MGYEPGKIYRIAKLSFAGEYDDETIYKWLRTILLEILFTAV